MLRPGRGLTQDRRGPRAPSTAMALGILVALIVAVLQMSATVDAAVSTGPAVRGVRNLGDVVVDVSGLVLLARRARAEQRDGHLSALARRHGLVASQTNAAAAPAARLYLAQVMCGSF